MEAAKSAKNPDIGGRRVRARVSSSFSGGEVIAVVEAGRGPVSLKAMRIQGWAGKWGSGQD